MTLILVLLSLATAGLAIGLFFYANRQERAEDVQMRLRAGDEATVAAVATQADSKKIDNAIVRWACHLLWRSGFDVRPSSVLLMMVIGVALMPLAILIADWIGGLLLIFGVVMVTSLVLGTLAANRRAKIVSQLPAYLEAVIRVLAAGNTLEEAIGSAAKETVEPSRTLFLSVSRQIRLGAQVDVVLAEAGDIYQIKDLRVIALAANINRRYGGTLRNVFRSLIQAIRMREAAARELRALTAETRFSAAVLAAIPIGLSVYLFVRNRGFYADMLSTKSGTYTLVFAAALQVLGVIVIWRMMKSTQENG